MKSHDYFQVFRDRNLAAILLLAFSSGLPLALTSGTLQAWLTVEGVDLSTIGIFTLVGIPYTWKFLWAPAMDRFVPPFLGRRRGWLLVTQATLVAGIATLAMLSPREDLALVAFLAVLIAFASASQDIVVDAYRTDIATREQRGVASALYVVGYRISMLVSGALALVLVAGSAWIAGIGWRNTYLVMAALMGVGLLALIPILAAFGIGFAGVASGTLVLAVPLVALAVVIFLATLVVINALSGIFRTALYRYAVDGTVPGAFADVDLASAFGSKKTRRGFTN